MHNQCHRKGYSLYRRQVSLIPVEIPFPKGTSTPSRVVVAVGSGAVLPKPRKGKKHYLTNLEGWHQILHIKKKTQPVMYYIPYVVIRWLGGKISSREHKRHFQFIQLSTAAFIVVVLCCVKRIVSLFAVSFVIPIRQSDRSDYPYCSRILAHTHEHRKIFRKF